VLCTGDQHHYGKRWSGRFKFVDELKRMGANISVDGKMAVVQGVDG
jgi:UDP-N-acetylglucosamine enolpyruvyl transferase